METPYVVPEYNKVIYLDPWIDPVPPMNELLLIPSERALADNAVAFFMDPQHWSERDLKGLITQYKKRGWNMFVWRYYRIGRCYLSGYKALSACLKLKNI